jgi:hypothetical protein
VRKKLLNTTRQNTPRHKNAKRIRESLALATCSLLATSPQSSMAEEYEAPWEIDSSLLIYSERDRVSAFKPVLSLRKEIGDDEFLGFRLVADALTGASPNGAVPTDTAQTFTSPSGENGYTTPANEIPLDDSFEDFRLAFSTDWEKPLTDSLKGVFGFNFSTETDYTSIGLSSTFSKDLNQKQTTLAIGISANFDKVNPQGGKPEGLETMPPLGGGGGGEDDDDDDDDDDGDDDGFFGSLFKGESKNVSELLIGITQIINRFTLTQVNYSIGKSEGYLNDPYKILSVLANDGSGDLRVIDPYVYEKLINVSYRYFWDDWDISSHTTDLRYRWEIGGGHYLQPHVRYYQQNAASFYRQTLIDGEELTLEYASADYRLGNFTTQTLGLKYGIFFDNGAEISLRVETMQQRGETESSDAIGKLQNVNLYPDMDASIIQAGISLDTDIISKFFGKLFGNN